MPPLIHFIRHAQGYHNLNTANHAIHDPLLTPYGQQQCAHLAQTFPYTSSIDMIVASPLKRTVWTALLSFPNKQLQVVLVPELQETSDLPCDTGSPKAELEHEFEDKCVDMHLVVDGWNSKTGKWTAKRSAIEERCRVVRRWLREQKAKDIAVVTHGGLLHFLTEDWSDSNKFAGTGWANTEYRTYAFDPLSSAENASLVETAESKTRRRGVEKPLTEAEQVNLKRTANLEFERNGYIRPEQQYMPEQVQLKIPAKV